MRLPLLFLATLFIFSSCKKDEANNGMNFKLQYDGAPLVMFTDVTYPNGKRMQFQRISFYISEINLSKDNSVVHTQEVDYLDLSVSHSTTDGAAAGMNLSFDTSEETLDYDNISFNIGLTEEMNASLPADYLSSSPLSKSSEYWSNWGTYIAIRLEGNIDKNEDGEYGAGEPFTLHLGTDNVTRSISQSLDSEGMIDVVIDVEKIFTNTKGVIYDLENFGRLHELSDENIARMTELSNNLEASLTVE